MYLIQREKRLQLQFVGYVVAIGAAMLSVVFLAPASAQTRPADIKAKERQDPASGDVVVINRKTRKSGAPNPYAPAKKATVNAKTKSKKSTEIASPKPIIRRQNEIVGAAPTLTPPLPKRNTARRTSTARLRQFPRPELGTPGRRTNEFPAPRRAERRFDDRRTYARRRAPPRYSRHRPWRQCRRLARRCQAGFEGSCYMWQRRCI